MIRYTKLAADGSDLPSDATDHLAVRIDRDILARPIILTAHRSAERMNWQDAKKWAEGLDIYGWSWRLPTIEEAVMLVDYDRTAYPLLPPEFFPDCEGEWIWTGTEDRTPPSGYARCVGLSFGGSGVGHQSDHDRVRAVRGELAKERGGMSLQLAEYYYAVEADLRRQAAHLVWAADTLVKIGDQLSERGASSEDAAAPAPAKEGA